MLCGVEIRIDLGTIFVSVYEIYYMKYLKIHMLSRKYRTLPPECYREIFKFAVRYCKFRKEKNLLSAFLVAVYKNLRKQYVAADFVRR